MAKNIHFIGIGGIGNSSLAQILHEKGFNISGSDLSPSDITKSLKLKGITINYEHKAANINKRHNKIIYSPAIPENNTELLEAKKLKIPCLTYPQALGEFSKDYYTIAISGTHGKSTTTAMTAKIFIDAGLDPTVVIGTKMRELKNKNYRKGDSKYLIIEACEYKKSFLNFTPNILVITNIEADHLDYYKTLANYRKAFEEMVSKVPKNGKIIIPGDGKIKKLIKSAKAEIVTAKSKIKPGIPGDFNISNASLATEVALSQNIPISRIEKSLKNYKGSWRRLQYKRKKLGKTLFIDDYAHHPTEIKMTLTAIREDHPHAKLLCIFQPHQYSRTKTLLKEFGKAFIDADKVIIPNIYKVRDSEEDMKKVSTDVLVNEINKYDNKAQNGNGLKETANYIKTRHKNFDLIVTMGAGDIGKIYKMF